MSVLLEEMFPVMLQVEMRLLVELQEKVKILFFPMCTPKTLPFRVEIARQEE